MGKRCFLLDVPDAKLRLHDLHPQSHVARPPAELDPKAASPGHVERPVAVAHVARIDVTCGPSDIGLVVGAPIVRRELDRILDLCADDDAHEVIENRRETGPPVVIARAQALHDFRIQNRRVGALVRIGLDVVELLAVYQSPPLRHHCRAAPFDRHVDPLRVDEERAVVEPCRLVFQQGHETLAVESELPGNLSSSELGKRRQDVDMRGEIVDVASSFDPASRPANEERDAVATVIFRALPGPHPRVEAFEAAGLAAPVLESFRRSVVGHEYEDGVLR